MDPDAAEAIREQIDSDETLIWADRPDATLTPFYPLLFCLLIAARLYVSRPRSPTSLQVAIAASGFVFLLSRLVNRHVYYGLTTRRAITVLSFFGRTWTRSASLVNRLEAPIVIRRGFLGRVIFGRSGKNRGISPDDPAVGLILNAVANAEGICEQARAAQQRMLVEIDARSKARRAN
jgi:hypothetical protein